MKIAGCNISLDANRFDFTCRHRFATKPYGSSPIANVASGQEPRGISRMAGFDAILGPPAGTCTIDGNWPRKRSAALAERLHKNVGDLNSFARTWAAAPEWSGTPS